VVADFDFIDITLRRNYDRWPVFNFADSAVTIGILILLFFYRKGSSEEKIPAAESGRQEMLNSDEQSTESGIKEL
jgi:hypothetical protein